MKTRTILLSISICALITITIGAKSFVLPHALEASSGIVSLGSGQRARLIVVNTAAPDPTDEKGGTVPVTLKFILYRPGQAVGNGVFTHVLAGEHSSGEIVLPPGQGLSMDIAGHELPQGVGAIRPVLSLSSLRGGTSAPVKVTLEIIDSDTGKTNSISIDVVSAGFYEGWPAK